MNAIAEFAASDKSSGQRIARLHHHALCGVLEGMRRNLHPKPRKRFRRIREIAARAPGLADDRQHLAALCRPPPEGVHLGRGDGNRMVGDIQVVLRQTRVLYVRQVMDCGHHPARPPHDVDVVAGRLAQKARLLVGEYPDARRGVLPRMASGKGVQRKHLANRTLHLAAVVPAAEHVEKMEARPARGNHARAVPADLVAEVALVLRNRNGVGRHEPAGTLRPPTAVIHLLHIEQSAQVQSGDRVVGRGPNAVQRPLVRIAAHREDHVHAIVLHKLVERKPARLAPDRGRIPRIHKARPPEIPPQSLGEAIECASRADGHEPPAVREFSSDPRTVIEYTHRAELGDRWVPCRIKRYVCVAPRLPQSLVAPVYLLQIPAKRHPVGPGVVEMPVLGPVLPLHELPVHAAGEVESDHDVRCGRSLQVVAKPPQAILDKRLPLSRRVGERPALVDLPRIERRRIESGERLEVHAPANALLVDENRFGMPFQEGAVRIEIDAEYHPGPRVCAVNPEERILDAGKVPFASLGIPRRLVERHVKEKPRPPVERHHYIPAALAHKPVVCESLVLVQRHRLPVHNRHVAPIAPLDGRGRRRDLREPGKCLRAICRKRILLVVYAAIWRGLGCGAHENRRWRERHGIAGRMDLHPHGHRAACRSDGHPDGMRISGRTYELSPWGRAVGRNHAARGIQFLGGHRNHRTLRELLGDVPATYRIGRIAAHRIRPKHDGRHVPACVRRHRLRRQIGYPAISVDGHTPRTGAVRTPRLGTERHTRKAYLVVPERDVRSRRSRERRAVRINEHVLLDQDVPDEIWIERIGLPWSN